MMILSWCFTGVDIVNIWTHLINLKTMIWRSVQETFAASIQNIIPERYQELIYGSFLTFIYLLSRVKIIIRRVSGRIWLVLRNIWSTDALPELLSLQQEYLEVMLAQRSSYEYHTLDKFQDSLNHILATGSRVCLRHVGNIPDLYAHFCDVATFIRLLYSLCKCAVRYVQAKRAARMTETWILVVNYCIIISELF